ncbi:Yqey-like protein [compost metagenome]
MLYEQIKTQIIATMKTECDDRTLRLLVLRGLKSAIDAEAKVRFGMSESAATPPDDLVESVLVREIKKRQDSMQQYAKVGATELHDKELTETKIIAMFLPEQLGKQEVELKIDEVIESVGKNIGPVMKEMKAWAGARFPGKELADLVKAKLV